MAQFVNPLIVNNFIDANIMDDIADGKDDAVNRIIEMNQNNEIEIHLPYSVQDELNHSNTPAHVG